MQINFNTQDMSNQEATAMMMLLISLFPAAGQTAIGAGGEPHQIHAADAPATNFAAAAKFTVPKDDVLRVVIGGAGGSAAISPDDNPAAGTATASEVFTQGFAAQHIMTDVAAGVSYEEHITKGWTDALLIEHGFMLPPVTLAPPATSAAAVFGAPPAPLAVTNGAPPAPNSAAATAPPPPSDAASVFAATSGTPAPQPDDASDAAGSTPPAPSGMLDSDGLPWDGRIHASTRTTTAKGVWKKKKGVDEALTAAVTAELRQAQAANKAAAHVPLNAAPPPPAAGSAAPPPPSGAPATFVDVAKYVGERKFTAEQILTVCKAHGLPGLGLLTGAPALCAPMMAAFQAL